MRALHHYRSTTWLTAGAGWLTLVVALSCESMPDPVPTDTPGDEPGLPRGPGDVPDIVPDETPPMSPPEVDTDDDALGALLGVEEDSSLFGDDLDLADENPVMAPEDDRPEVGERPGDQAVLAVLVPRSGSDVSGWVRVYEGVNSVVVTVEVEGASPGLHGVHFHQTADCSAFDATSAGDHFAPRGNPHGLWGTVPRHLGDLGNIEVGPDGRGTLVREVAGATLDIGGERSFYGRALIVHEQPDDGQGTSGNAGDRQACAEILRVTDEGAPGEAPPTSEPPVERSPG